jgi:class 3 adenylate cyclase
MRGRWKTRTSPPNGPSVPKLPTADRRPGHHERVASPTKGSVSDQVVDGQPSPPPDAPLTFLFTDVEGSTRLWETNPQLMRSALARHDEIIRAAIADSGGNLVKTTGDGLMAVFATPDRAVEAGIAAPCCRSRPPSSLATFRTPPRCGTSVSIG